MRIGIDIKPFKNGSTGISRYLRSIMDWLQKIDNENEYFLFECRSCEYRIENPRWKKVLIHSKLPGILWQQFILPFHLKKNKIDILWASEQICPFFYTGGAKIITSVFDFTPLRFPDTCQRSNLIIQKYLFPLTIKKSQFLIPISDFVKREVLYFYPECDKNVQIRTVPCGGPDWELPQDYNRENRQDFLFFAGNLEPRKNLINVIEALEILHNSGIDIPLHIAGPQGWRNKDLFEKLDQSPVRDNIKFLGYITEEELKKEYMICKAVIYPSIYEGFGLPVLEALCLNAVVLTSKNTVMEEIAGEAGIYFNPEDPYDIADKIRTLDKFAVGQSGHAEKIINEYKWSISARKLLDLFRELQVSHIRSK
jgi:glycosyltransferase involved in cell wall biosynthesis